MQMNVNLEDRQREARHFFASKGSSREGHRDGKN